MLITGKKPPGPAGSSIVAEPAVDRSWFRKSPWCSWRAVFLTALVVSLGQTATIDVYTASSANDAQETVSSTVVSITGTQLRLGSTYVSGFRFSGVNVPKGATITTSYIYFYSSTAGCGGAGSINVTVKAELASNSSAFAASNANISGRTWTSTGNVTWATIDWGYEHVHNANTQTSSLNGIVSQVTSQSGWASGNAMSFLFTGASDGRCVAPYDDGAGAYDAQLHIEYTSLASGKTVTSSNEALGADELAVDGNTGTRWETVHATDPQWIYVDLGANYYVGSVYIDWQTAAADEYSIQVETAASGWTNNLASVSNGTAGENRTLTAANSLYGRYVRMYGWSRVDGQTWGYSIYEFEVYAGSNSTPTDIALSASTIAENAGANATVGTLSATDANVNDTKTYTLVAGTGSTDNALFNISGTTLRATNSLDYEAAGTRSVRVRITDAGGEYYEEAFTITVTDVAEDPDIAVTGKGAAIADADASPTTADGTDFGTRDVDYSEVVSLFTIKNTGASNLTLTGGTPITLSGGNASHYSVVQAPSSTIAAGDSTYFKVRYNPTATGTHNSVTVTIANNDPDAEGSYTFTIQGVCDDENYTSGWNHYMTLTLNTTSTGANVTATDVTNFPVLVRLNATNFNFNEALANGADIRFSSTDAATHYAFDIDRWDDTDLEAEIWVRIPTVTKNSKTQQFRMYYDNTGETGRSEPQSVFLDSDGWTGIWHLNNYTEARGVFPDATVASAPAATDQNNCIIGDCYDFDNDDNLAVAYHPELDQGSTFSVLFWAQYDAAAAPLYDRMVSRKNEYNDAGGWEIYGKTGDDDALRLQTAGANDDNAEGFTSSWIAHAWNHVAVTFNGTAGIVYKEGASFSTPTLDAVADHDVGVGFGEDANATSDNWDGKLDEIWIYDGILSDDFIKLAYENQKAEQTLLVIEDYDEWTYNYDINLNTTSSGANVMGNVDDFPVLLRITGSNKPTTNFFSSETQSGGSDLRFSKSTDETIHYPYEIEYWNGTDTADIWVLVDRVPGNTNGELIRMYWGKTAVGTGTDPDNTFRTTDNFNGVWHLAEDPSGGANAVKDATVNAGHGTSYGTMTTGDLIDGAIGKGIDLDGGDDYIYASGASLPTGDFTFSMWVKLHADADHALFMASDGAGNNELSVWYNITRNGSHINGTWYDPGGTKLDYEWRLVHLTRSGGTVTVYHDATSRGSSTDATTLDFGSCGIIMGADADASCATTMGQYTDGLIDEARISKVARSTDWLKLEYQNQRSSQTLVVFNQAPVASSVSISGTKKVGQTLTGSYSYSDNESDAESGTTFKWYRSDDPAGTNKAQIAGETNSTYTLAAADEYKYISFEVTPVAASGASPGTAVESSTPFYGPVTNDYSSWTYSQDLGLNTTSTGAGVSVDVADFPVLLRITDANKPTPGFFTEETETGGADLRFIKYNDANTAYPYQIEYWNNADTALIWVLVDNVRGGISANAITMYWGKSGASSMSSPEATFDIAKGFDAVWHLQGSNNTDATNSNLDLTNSGSVDGAGMIGDGQNFTASESDYLKTSGNYSPDAAEGMVSFWFKADLLADEDRFVGSEDEYEISMEGNKIDGDIMETASGPLYSTTAPSTGTWYHVAVRYRASDDSNYIFINGAEENSNALANNGFENDQPFYIGRGGLSVDYFDGIIDEVRLEDDFRSHHWVKLCYENQKANQTLVVFDYADDYQGALRIYWNTTNSGGGANVTGNVTNIPMLVRLDSTIINYSLASLDGSDLQFIDKSGDPLYHDVAEWNRWDTSYVWVKVPQVDGNSSADYVDLYYGCSGCSQGFRNGDSVWTGYAGVWHMPGNLENILTDAGSGDLDGSYVRSQAFGGGVTTSLAPFFDGSNDYGEMGDVADQTTNDFTLYAWIKPTVAPASTDAVIHKETGGTGYMLGIRSGLEIECGIGDGSYNTSPIDGSTASLNSWSLISAVFDRDGNQTRYLNGAATGTADAITGESGSVSSAAVLAVGARQSDGSQKFNGYIQEARIATSALSANYLKLSYENQKAGATMISTNTLEGPVAVPGLQLWLRADSGLTGTSDVSEWRDITSNNRDLSSPGGSNAPVYNASGVNGLPSLTFDGTNDYMINTGYNWEESAFTVFVVATTDITNANKTLVGTSVDGSFTAGIHSTGYAGIGKEGGTHNASSLAVTSARPQLYAFTSSGGTTDITVTCLLDGTTASASLNRSDFVDGEEFMLGGADDGSLSQAWDGEIAEVMVYNSRLSTVEMNLVEGYLQERYAMDPPSNITTLTASRTANGIKLKWTKPVSTSENVDTVGIWVGYSGFPDSSRGSQLVGLFDAEEAEYTFPATYPATYYFSLQTRRSTGIWSNTASSAQDSITIPGTYGSDSFKKLRFNTTGTGADVSGNVSNFQLLVRITSAELDLAASSGNGRDIFFLDSTGTDTLDYDIEYWDQSNDNALLWVSVPVVSGNSQTDFILMGYGDTSRAATESSEAVFPNSQQWKGVWHMDTTLDAGERNHDATKKTADEPHTESTIASCLIGKCQDFDGTNDYWTIPNAAPLDMGTTFTVMFWAKNEGGTPGGYDRIISRKDAWDNAAGWEISLQNANNTALECLAGGNTGYKPGTVVSDWSAGSWEHIVVKYKGTSNTVYANGDSIGTGTGLTAVSDNDYAWTFGDDQDYGETNFDGKLDEFRVIDADLSPNYIKLSYETQKASGSLISWGDTLSTGNITVYVDSATGDDDNSCLAARNPATPKLTLEGADDCVATCPTDTLVIRVMPGTYTGANNNAVYNITAGKYIRAEAFDADHPPIFKDGSTAQTMKLYDRTMLKNFIIKAGTNTNVGIEINSGSDEVAVIGNRIINSSASVQHATGINNSSYTSNYLLIANNIIHGATTYGIKVLADDYVNITHNVIYGYTQYGIHDPSTNHNEVNYTNNIFFNCDYGIAVDDDGLDYIRNNLYWNVTDPMYDLGVKTHAEDPDPVTADPLFASTDPYSPHYMKLSPGSPAIDEGYNTYTGWATTTGIDYWGNARSGTRDIGAYEGTGYSGDRIAGEFDTLIVSPAGTGSAATVSVRTRHWKIVFDQAEDGGIRYFYNSSDTTDNLLSGTVPLFDVSIEGSYISAQGATYQPRILGKNRVHAQVQQAVANGDFTITVTYNIFASGHIYIQSEIINTSGSNLTDDPVIYKAEMVDATSQFHNGGGNNGFGYLLSGTRDAYIGTVRDLDGLADMDFTGASATDQVTWTETGAGMDLLSKQGIQHHFLLYIGDDDLGIDKAEVLYSDTRNPAPLKVTQGTLYGEQSWQDQLQLHLPMDEGSGTDLADMSFNGRADTWNGTPTYTAGSRGTGIDLDGSADYITFPDNDVLDAEEADTYMMRVSFDASWTGSGTDAMFINKGGDAGWTLRRATSADRFEFKVNNTVAQDDDEITRTAGAWYHLAGVHQAGTIRLYVDGVLTGRQTGVSASGNGSVISIGSSNASNAFAGQVDDVRIYTPTLDESEIQAVANYGFSWKSGTYKVRANNNNRVVLTMNTSTARTRFQPAFEIDNWYGGDIPKYVYVDGVKQRPFIDFVSKIEPKIIQDGYSTNMGNKLEIQFNKALTGTDIDIFIDNDDSTGFMGASALMPELTMSISSGDLVIKNFDKDVFGDPDDNQWELRIDKSASSSITDGDGGIYSFKSSATDPQTAVSSATDILTSAATLDWFYLDDTWSSGSKAVTDADVTHTISDSSGVRLKVAMETVVFDGTGADDFDNTRTYTIYPTGRVYSYNKIENLDDAITDARIRFYEWNDITSSSYAWDKDTLDLKGYGGRISPSDTSRFHSFGVGVMRYKNAADNIDGPALIADYASAYSSIMLDIDLTDAYFASTDDPMEICYFIDIKKDYKTSDKAEMKARLRDPIQHGSITNIAGTVKTDDAFDLDGDGFAECEGAYTHSATSGVAHFQLTMEVTRFDPVFKIYNWTTRALPAFVLVNNQEKIRGYQYNAYVDGADDILIVAFNDVWPAPADSASGGKVNIYISQKNNLAVTLTKLEAVSGIAADTIKWTTQSEVDNAGYYILRREKPNNCIPSVTLGLSKGDRGKGKPALVRASATASPLRQAQGDGYCTDSSNIVSIRELKSGDPGGLAELDLAEVKSASSGWKRIKPGLIPGPEGGRSSSKKKYRWVDKTAEFGKVYQYALVAVDFHGQEQAFGPVEAMPQNPLETRLYGNFPNPFNPTTTIRFDLHTRLKVTADIFDIRGRRIRRLISPDQPMQPGKYFILWDARNDYGVDAATGHYFLMFRTDKGYKKVRKMTLLK